MSQEDGIVPPGIYGTQIPDTIPLLPTQDVKIFRQIYGVPQPQGSTTASTTASTVESDSDTCVQKLQGEIEAIEARLEELMGTSSKESDMSSDFLDDRALLSLDKTALELPHKGKRVVDPDSSETESDSDSDKALCRRGNFSSLPPTFLFFSSSRLCTVLVTLVLPVLAIRCRLYLIILKVHLLQHHDLGSHLYQMLTLAVPRDQPGLRIPLRPLLQQYVHPL
ncbi:hypothetical protein ARMGADRAFT_1008811 [Armillaria gallica]|uniref:Uncharacterized protein n=1 Tax=Armillaria gallica TaxID=47427 RepID=A0A2H3DWF6_ARMGA|nr:hypothetical protein ARMGADRAFT_1008811 [Armillaria gallica]